METTAPDVNRVTTLELFFDLVFVFTITQLTAVLYHAPTLRSLAQVVLMLGVIWWMYGGYAWMTNAVSAHTAIRRLLLLGGEGGGWAASLRAAVLLAEKGSERGEVLQALRGEHLGTEARDAVRRVLVETLLHGSRAELVAAVDETLIGLRPRPTSVLRVA